MPTTNFDVVQANVLLGVGPPKLNPFGSTWFVATTGLDGNDGNSPASPFLTIAQAISKGVAGDNIVIGPGTYTVTASISPKARQRFFAAIINPRNPTVSITSTSALTGDMLTVDVSGTEYFGIEFLAGHANIANLVDIADDGVVNGCWFDQCVFNGADKTTVVGIQSDDAVAANVPSGLMVTRCLFRDLTGICIDIGVNGIPYAYIGYNQFALDVNSGVGIALADTGAFATGKGYVIEYNTFTGFDSTADEVGITIAGTENATGAGIIRRNDFAYMAAAAITIDKMSLSEVQNYYGDATVGGVLVDPGT